jgi:predicted metal-dependent HD superfamily phosphohydrolase
MSWSKIQTTALDLEAYLRMIENELKGCVYHNDTHIDSMYQYLKDTEVPYDPVLDWAVLFHDVVYDNQPEKEKRSAELFVDLSSTIKGCDLSDTDKQHVYDLIMTTTHHVIDFNMQGCREIIMADLHQLTNVVSTIRNYSLIMDESMNLYKIDETTFARGNINFMEGMGERMELNIENSGNKRDIEFFLKVQRGININIDVSKTVLQ